MTDRSARDRALAGIRLATGAVGVLASVAVIAAVSLIALPSADARVVATRVTPEPAPLSLLCPGALLRLGDGSGADAASAASVGRASVVDHAAGTTAERATLTPSATDAAVITAGAARGAALSASQSQRVSTDELRGLAAASCRESASTAWLVGGATTTGRTALVTLSNPGAVSTSVQLRVWGESGPVEAPGLTGITVPARGQRVVSLTGLAPDTLSPVVEVTSVGGEVVAALQSAVTRTLDPGGVDLAGETVAPTRHAVIPGVRIADQQNVEALQGDEDYRDLRPAIRLLSPEGDTTATLTLRAAGAADESRSTVPLTAGTALDVPLDRLPTGDWTVTVDADRPVVAAVRAGSAAPLTGAELESPVSDLAWFVAPEPLGGTATFSVPNGPDATLTLANEGGRARTVTLTGGGGAASEVAVPAGGSVAVPVSAQAGYRLSGASGLRAAVTMVEPGAIASFAVASPRAGSQPIVVRP